MRVRYFNVVQSSIIEEDQESKPLLLTLRFRNAGIHIVNELYKNINVLINKKLTNALPAKDAL